MEYAYYLMLKDLKGEGDNVVILGCYDSQDRDKAFADLEHLKVICDETVEAWLEVEVLKE